MFLPVFRLVGLASIVCGSLLTAACGPPRIDNSTEEQLEASLETVREALSEEEREEFNAAVQTLAFEGLSLGGLLSDGASFDPDSLVRKIGGKLEGKTADEVVAEAERVRHEHELKQREQALAEIAELREKQASAEKAGEELKSFEVLRSRFYKRPQSFGGPEPIIELTVRNGTEHAISRAYFRGTIASPGRQVPWLKDEFNYSIRGGLEPGEEASWSLAPNMFSEWGSVDAPSDAVFTVDVVKLDGPDGEAVLDAEEFSDYAQERLQELENEFGK